MQSKHESVISYLGIVCLLSIPFWILGQVKPIQLLPGLPIGALMAFTPALSALIIMYKKDRLSGVTQLLRRSFDFKRIQDRGWFLAFIFIYPAITVLAYWFMRASGRSLPVPTPLTFAIVPMFLFFFIGALGEEIGWTGFATEPMQQRWGIIISGLLLGSIWAVWHFIPLLQVSRSAEWIAWWSLGTISTRMIMGWLFARSGKSVFAAAVFHALINLCWQLFPNNGSHYDPQVFGLITLSFVIVIFAIEGIYARCHATATAN